MSVIMDNAAAHKSREVEGYIRSINASVVRWFLPPHTPQQNPIEMQWPEIKRAVADTFFDGFDKLQERILNMLSSGEVPRKRLFGYMLGATCSRQEFSFCLRHVRMHVSSMPVTSNRVMPTLQAAFPHDTITNHQRARFLEYLENERNFLAMTMCNSLSGIMRQECDVISFQGSIPVGSSLAAGSGM